MLRETARCRFQREAVRGREAGYGNAVKKAWPPAPMRVTGSP